METLLNASHEAGTDNVGPPAMYIEVRYRTYTGEKQRQQRLTTPTRWKTGALSRLELGIRGEASG